MSNTVAMSAEHGHIMLAKINSLLSFHLPCTMCQMTGKEIIIVSINTKQRQARQKRMLPAFSLLFLFSLQVVNVGFTLGNLAHASNSSNSCCHMFTSYIMHVYRLFTCRCTV